MLSASLRMLSSRPVKSPALNFQLFGGIMSRLGSLGGAIAIAIALQRMVDK
jgi:hypothetical protein